MRVRRPRPRAAIVSEAAQKKIHARERREVQDKEVSQALERWYVMPVPREAMMVMTGEIELEKLVADEVYEVRPAMKQTVEKV